MRSCHSNRPHNWRTGTVATDISLRIAWPAWSPDGSRIAFLRQRPGDNKYDLYTINPDGTGLALLKDFVADGDSSIPGGDSSSAFDWSPDGTKIIKRNMYLVDLVTGGQGGASD